MQSSEGIKIFALIISFIFIIRIMLSIFIKKSALKMSTNFYTNKFRKYLYLLFFLGGSIILFHELNIYQFMIAFVTMGALYFDYYNSGIIPNHIKKELLPYIFDAKKMWVFMFIGGIFSGWTILKFINII